MISSATEKCRVQRPPWLWLAAFAVGESGDGPTPRDGGGGRWRDRPTPRPSDDDAAAAGRLFTPSIAYAVLGASRCRRRRPPLPVRPALVRREWWTLHLPRHLCQVALRRPLSLKICWAGAKKRGADRSMLSSTSVRALLLLSRSPLAASHAPQSSQLPTTATGRYDFPQPFPTATEHALAPRQPPPVTLQPATIPNPNPSRGAQRRDKTK